MNIFLHILFQLLFLVFGLFTIAYPQNVYWPYQSKEDNGYVQYISSKNIIKENKSLFPFTDNVLLNSIAFYHRTLSKGKCQYFPSCSRYTYLGIKQYGSLKGLILGAERFTRCTYYADASEYQKIGPYFFDPANDFFQIDQANIKVDEARLKYALFEASKDETVYDAINEKINTTDSTNQSQIQIPLFDHEVLTDPDLSFAVFLYREKQFYRVVTELYRFIHKNKQFSVPNEIYLLIACCQFQAGRYLDVIHLYDNLNMQSSLNTDLKIIFDYLIGLSYYKISEFELAKKIFFQLSKDKNSNLIKNQSITLCAVSCLKTNDLKLRNELQSSSPENINRLMNNSLNRLEMKRKSPSSAALFSAIIPGSGQLYAGSYRESIKSFILNACLGTIFYYSCEKGGRVSQTISGFFTLQFYTGNIIGGKRAAMMHNEQEKRKIIEDILDQKPIPENFSIIEESNLIYLRVH